MSYEPRFVDIKKAGVKTPAFFFYLIEYYECDTQASANPVAGAKGV